MFCIGIGCSQDRFSQKTNDKQTLAAEGRKEKPVYPGFRSYQIYPGSDSIFMRVIANNDIMVKAWMVYYSGNKWVKKEWKGNGMSNAILGDMIFTKDGETPDLSKTIDLYFASSQDNGKSWVTMDTI